MPEDYRGVDLRLLFAPSAAWRVRDYFHPKEVSVQPDERLLVACTFPEDQWLLSFLLSFGAGGAVAGLLAGYFKGRAKKIFGCL